MDHPFFKREPNRTGLDTRFQVLTYRTENSNWSPFFSPWQQLLRRCCCCCLESTLVCVVSGLYLDLHFKKQQEKKSPHLHCYYSCLQAFLFGKMDLYIVEVVRNLRHRAAVTMTILSHSFSRTGCVPAALLASDVLISTAQTCCSPCGPMAN